MTKIKTFSIVEEITFQKLLKNMSNNSTSLKTIVDFARRKGLVYQGSEIYGGLANTWDFGPLGVLLKNNIKSEWRQHFITERCDMVEIDASIFMNPKVWEASGHTAGFADCLIDDKTTKHRFRVDHLIEDQHDIDVEGWTPAQINDLIVQKGLNNPHTGKQGNWTEARYMNLMFETNRDKTNTSISIVDDILSKETVQKEKIVNFCKKHIDLFGSEFDPEKILINSNYIEEYLEKVRISGQLGDEDWQNINNLAHKEKVDFYISSDECFSKEKLLDIRSSQIENRIYLRPETAQGIFVNFKNVIQTERRKLPFGIGQIGKAFRNEITPGNFIFRVLELEQMEIEYFIKPPIGNEWNEKFEELLESQETFYTQKLGFDSSNIRKKEHLPEKLSHYSKSTVDFEYNYPIGFSELSGLAYRTDFDLKQHSKYSGIDLTYLDPETNQRYTPHCIEPSVGVERLFLATLCEFYSEQIIENPQNTELEEQIRELEKVLETLKID